MREALLRRRDGGGVAADAVHHGAGAVRALRGEVIADADLAKDLQGVDAADTSSARWPE